MQQPRATPPISSHEDLFLQRYQWLMDAALRLTGRDQEEAEDLVHDVFIHFTLDRPDLERLTNLEGYLYTMLRNLHVSQIRRAARIRATTASPSDLSLTDYDFVEDGLRALEERTQDVQDELRRICQYACARRGTSKAGSVLILRFFHGYYAAEIATILRTSRATADKWLQIARSEARAYLRDPNALAFIARGSTAELAPITSTHTTEDFVEQLRKAIFQPQDAKCFGVEQLKRLYSAASAVSVDCEGLSHLVSCAVCLDEVNRLLGLPLLADRYPTKMLRQDTHKKGGSGRGGASKGSSGRGSSGGSSGDDFMTRSRRRLKKVIEHRPQQLRVSVNGFILASHDVSSELNKQTISVKGDEKIGFVEVFSEQEVRLLFANVAPPPDGPAEQSKRVELSEGRELELTVDFAESWPAVHVIYRDPTFAVAKSGVASLESIVEPKSNASERPPDRAPQESARGLRNKLRALRRDFRLRAPDWRLFLRPATATVIVAALLIVALFVWLRQPVAPVPVADLLARASAAEEVLAAGDQVIHRTINFEEKKITGELIARRKIEVWQSAEKGITARRLYDEKGSLVAGDWRRADGVQTLYSHGSRPQIKSVPERQGVAASLNFENAWQLLLSAKEFTSLITVPDKIRIEERPAEYLISYSRDASAEASGIVKVGLVLSRADLHATKETFTLRQGNEVREYTMMEASFERRPLSTVAPSVFEPDAVLLSSLQPEPPTSKLETNTLAPGPQPPPPVLATAELEVEVLRLLNQAGADMGEQVSVTRTPEGLLEVQGLTQTDRRKRELVSALSPVAGNRAVRLDIQTLDEALARQPKNKVSSGSISVETTQPSSNTLPIDQELRHYFAGRNVPEAQVEEGIRQFADRTLRRSLQMLKHAAALNALAQRFSPEELRTMDPDAKAKWLLLIKQHAERVQQETAILRREVAPIFPAVASQKVNEPVEIQSDADLARAVQQLFGVCSENDRAIRLAFSISPEASKDSVIRSAQFWRSLALAEALAGKIAASK
jgi:RNA polymerase sigma factor (sigma-70 family)